MTAHCLQGSTCLLFRVHFEDINFGHRSRNGALSDTLSRRSTKMSPRTPIKETSLSTLSFTCHVVAYDTEYFCNALYLEDFFLGCYCLVDTITHQNEFSRGSHKSTGTKQ